MTVRFADCRLDLDARRLLRGTREMHLAPKAFELLRVLLENRPRALSKAELLERVWPGVFVSDANLAKVVSHIRESLGDEARDPRIIRTVHGYGYAFAADVDADAPRQTISESRRSTCWLACGRREFALPDGEHVAGRDIDASIWLDSLKVSRRHAKVLVSGVDAVIQDLESKNGTFVRGVRIAARTALKAGDKIRIGEFRLTFHVARATASTETEIAARARHSRVPKRSPTREE